MMAFFLLDVRPAIAARRREPREDLISHLISRGYSDMNILTECITYGAAGMVTTREFITWQPGISWSSPGCGSSFWQQMKQSARICCRKFCESSQ